jgi:hypothetical protein
MPGKTHDTPAKLKALKQGRNKRYFVKLVKTASSRGKRDLEEAAFYHE